MKTQFCLAAGGALTLALLALLAHDASGATIVDVDATDLGLNDGDTIDTIANPGLAGLFTTVTGLVEAASHPANDNATVMVQGMAFDGDKMTAAQLAADVGLSGNQPHTVRAWVWNPDIAAEEAIVAWGRRGGPDGTNAGFHQGTNPAFGAVGHWGGGPDVGWGNGGADINDTLGRWANLAFTFDGAESKVFIDGVLSNSEVHGALNVHAESNPISIGSENNADAPFDIPIPFTGTIARVQVLDTVMTEEQIEAAFNTERTLFFDGVRDDTDTDGDGISDEQEDMHACLDKTVPDADMDADSDGLSNQQELLQGTDPCDPDTDGDNVSDGDEVNRMAGGQPAATNPLNPDTDGDGLTDDVETDTGINNGPSDTGTDPLVADTDGDGLSDSAELAAGSDPFDEDSDDDGFGDSFEVAAGTDPSDPQSTPNVPPATIVNVDATNLGVADGNPVSSIANVGRAGPFSTVAGEVVAASHPSNNDPGVSIQGLAFDGDKMTAASLAPEVGLEGNQVHTVRAWVWNPAISDEEAIVSWGRRGGPDGTNAGFHQGVHAAFGALGHWGGGPDVGWGNGGADILVTVGRWANLAFTFDGTESKVFIDGVLSNSEAHGSLNVHGETNPVSIGSENEAGNPAAVPIPFTGTIARVEVLDTVLTETQIRAAFENEKILFFDGVRDRTDSDGDGLVDALEDRHPCLDKNISDSSEDPDNDGLTSLQEVQGGTDPCDPDSDGDGLSDGEEVNRMVGGQPAPTDPNDPDTDGDGLTDNVETNTGVNNGPTDTGTDPLVRDMDGDGLTDGAEIAAGTDPFDEDSDDDGFNDAFELAAGSDPNNAQSVPNVSPSTIVNVDATTLGVDDGTAVAQIVNVGRAGPFTTVTGEVVAASHPSNNDPGALVQGLGFDGDKMTAAELAPDMGLEGNQEHTVLAWIWNPGLVDEEAIVAWGRRGGPDGTNAGFHQGVHPAFGALGHWGDGPDLGWGNGGADINDTIARWAHLGYVYDGTESRVFIDGALNNSEAHGPLAVHGEMNPISIGSENEAGNPLGAPIPFTGTIAQVEVHDIAFSDQEVLAAFEAGAPLFFDGVEPSDARLGFDVSRSGDDLILTWDSQAGKLYNLRSDGDLQPDPMQWTIELENIEATPPRNTLTIPRPAATEFYFAIEEFPKPPASLFSDDFESGQGAWTVGTVMGSTEWEIGTPVLVGPSGANSPANAFGTDLDGNYGDNSETFLRSPVIDLSEATAATLRYFQATDIETMFDGGTVSVLDASDDSVIAVLETGIDGTDLDWSEVTHSLPEEALGGMVIIEFRFTADDFNPSGQAGWYIDDLQVTGVLP